MARPEEGYPAATHDFGFCPTCQGSGTIADNLDSLCPTCEGHRTSYTSTYRWYEPIKILPPYRSRHNQRNWNDVERQLRAKGWNPDPVRQAYIIRNHVLG